MLLKPLRALIPHHLKSHPRHRADAVARADDEAKLARVRERRVVEPCHLLPMAAVGDELVDAAALMRGRERLQRGLHHRPVKVGDDPAALTATHQFRARYRIGHVTVERRERLRAVFHGACPS